MKKIIIIGCGFAGLSAIQKLSQFKSEFKITLIDKSLYFNFLPLLPDIIGRDIHPHFVTYPIKLLSHKFGFDFIEEEVKAVDLDKNTVLTTARELPYDYIIITSGSETNFYGNNQIKQCAYKLDDAQDAKLIRETIQSNDFDYYIISGAGYTGIEIATNLRLFLNKKSRNKSIIIVEKAPSILGPLPDWIKDYVMDNLRRLNIQVYLNSSIAQVEKDKVILSAQQTFNKAMLIWAAGVKTSDYIQKLNVEKNPQGRLKVDRYLRIGDNCFVAGDTSYFTYKNTFLRMAVQFAIKQGVCAATNNNPQHAGYGPAAISTPGFGLHHTHG